MQKRTVNWIVLVIIISVLFYIGFVFYSGMDEVIEAFNNLDYAYVSIVLAIVFVAYFLRGIRWNYYLRCIDIHLSWKEGILVYFSGLSMLITPLMVSGAIKVSLLKARVGSSLTTTFPIVVVERLTDLVGLLVFVLIGMWLFIDHPGVISVTIFTICFLVAVIVIVNNRALCDRILRWMKRTRFGDKIDQPSEELYATLYTLLTPRILFTASLITLASWGLQGFALYVLFMGMGIDLDMLTTLFIFAFPVIFGIISQLPGGIGAEEGGMLGLMVVAGIARGISGAAVLLFRVLTLWFGLIMGIIALKYFTAKYLDDNLGAEKIEKSEEKDTDEYGEKSTAPGEIR